MPSLSLLLALVLVALAPPGTTVTRMIAQTPVQSASPPPIKAIRFGRLVDGTGAFDRR